MRDRVVAAVTLGQSPRADILDEMRALVPTVRWIEHGALDDVDEHDLSRFAPQAGEFPLVTRVRTGRPIVVGDVTIRPLLQRAIDNAAKIADLVVLLCSSPVSLESRGPLLCPDRLLSAAVAALASDNLIAVVTPRADQVRTQQERWQRAGLRSVVLHASPFGKVNYAALGRRARASGASVIVLDCIAYSSDAKAQLEEASGLPTILARSVVASMAKEIARPAIVARTARVGSATRATQPTNESLIPVGPSVPGRHARRDRLFADRLRACYSLGLIGPGDRLPSVRALARDMRVSPTTVAEWYRQLHERGLLTSRRGSGTYLNALGTSRVAQCRDVTVSAFVDRVLRQFQVLGMSLRDATELLDALTDTRRARMKFGCLMPLEFFEFVFAAADARLGMALPRVFLNPGRTHPQLHRQLVAEPAARVLLTTSLHYATAERLADELGRELIVMQLDPRTSAFLCGRSTERCLLVRDSDTAELLRSLIDASGRGLQRPVVRAIGEPDAVVEAERAREALLVSAAAVPLLTRTTLNTASLSVWRPQLSDRSVSELLNTYFRASLRAPASRTLSHA
jgi:protein AroM